MIAAAKNIFDYRELLQVLVWNHIALRYKQSYLGVVWLVLRPLMLVGIFLEVGSFLGIDSGKRPNAQRPTPF